MTRKTKTPTIVTAGMHAEELALIQRINADLTASPADWDTHPMSQKQGALQSALRFSPADTLGGLEAKLGHMTALLQHSRLTEEDNRRFVGSLMQSVALIRAGGAGGNAKDARGDDAGLFEAIAYANQLKDAFNGAAEADDEEEQRALSALNAAQDLAYFIWANTLDGLHAQAKFMAATMEDRGADGRQLVAVLAETLETIIRGAQTADAELLALAAEIRADIALYDDARTADEAREAIYAAQMQKENRLAGMVPKTAEGALALAEMIAQVEQTSSGGDEPFINRDCRKAHKSLCAGLRQMARKGGAG